MRSDKLYCEVWLPWWQDQQVLYVPWMAESNFTQRLLPTIKGLTLLTSDRLWVLYQLAQQAEQIPHSVFVECGVYKGGSAIMLANVAKPKDIYLFDSFEGLPEPDPDHDRHKKGDFADVVVEGIDCVLPMNAHLVVGNIPDTFPPVLYDKLIALAHIDVDLYHSVADCCHYLYGQMVRGGVMIFDDYGGWDTPGAADAVDEYFMKKPEVPLILPTGQAIVTKL